MSMNESKTVSIDGDNFSDFKGFVDEFSVKVFGDFRDWGGGLDSLNDILNTRYGISTGPLTIRWRHSAKSKKDLGHEAMLQWLLKGRPRVHPTGIEFWDKRVELAKKGRGETLFMLLATTIIGHKDVIIVFE